MTHHIGSRLLRWFHMAQDGPKEASKMAQDASKTAQDDSKTAQEASKTAQDAPKQPQDGPGRPPDASKTAPRRPQDGPRGAKEASKTAPGRLQEPSWLPDLSREPPGSLPDPPGRPLEASGSDFHVEMLASNKDQKTIQGSIQAVSKFDSLSTHPQGPINASRVLGGRWQRAKPLR